MRTKFLTFFAAAALLVACGESGHEGHDHEGHDHDDAKKENTDNTAKTVSAANGTYNVNAKESTVKWTGKKVTGQHDGTVALKSGKIKMSDGVIQAGSTFTIDMTTIEVKDIEDAKSNADLKGHLLSEDFFDTANHGEAMFTVTDASGKGDMQKVAGDLTIKGQTHPASFEVTTAPKGNDMMAKGTIVFDRTKYDIKYKSGSFFEDLGDKVIYDEVTLDFSIAASK